MNRSRFKALDTDWARETLEYFESEINRMGHIADDKDRSQLEYAMFADANADCGFLRYALGYPLLHVHKAFANAAQSYLKVYELRETPPFLEYATETLSPKKEINSPEYPGEVQQDGEGMVKKTDDSLTNSRRGLQAMCLASIVDGVGLARDIARLVGDSPDANYLGEDSVVCTFFEQRVAYAFKALLLGEPQIATDELHNFTTTDDILIHQAMALNAWAASDSTLLISSLNQLVQAHKQKAELEENLKEPSYYICIFALAVCALVDELRQSKELPINNPFLPLDLLEITYGEKQ